MKEAEIEYDSTAYDVIEAIRSLLEDYGLEIVEEWEDTTLIISLKLIKGYQEGFFVGT